METKKDENLVLLHSKIKEISFVNKYKLESIFEDTVAGILGIDYFSVMIIDANKILSCYSTAPTVEFYLIESGLWVKDGIFKLQNHIHGNFIFWDDLYEQPFKEKLIEKKQRKFGFNFGFFIMKQIKELFVIYSFATKKETNKEFYRNSIPSLNRMADYFFEEIRDIYLPYIIYTAPETVHNRRKIPPYLKLIK